MKDDFTEKVEGARIVNLGSNPVNFLDLLAGAKEALWTHYPEIGPLAADSDYEDFSSWFNDDGDLEDAYLHVLVKNGKVEGLIGGGLTHDPHSDNGTITYLVGNPFVKQALIDSAMTDVDAEALFIEQYNDRHNETADPEEVTPNTADRAFLASENAEQVPFEDYRQPIGPGNKAGLENLDFDVLFRNLSLTPEQKSETTPAFWRGYVRNYGDDARNLDKTAEYTRDLQGAPWSPLAETKPELAKFLNLDLE